MEHLYKQYTFLQGFCTSFAWRSFGIKAASGRLLSSAQQLKLCV